MKILDLVQGSDQWLEARLNCLCASEAPAMMGDSKFMSRNQLLDLKKGWKSNPDSSFKKRLYEKGHEHEEQAREITEMEYCEEFPAVVGFGSGLLASFDGLSGVQDAYLPWEHKSWNLTLAENVRNGVLEPLYYWQLEHQMIVADCDKILFTCSDGTQDNRVSMVYQSVPERREKLIAGWEQFLGDLYAHEIKAKQENVVAVKTSLPVITFDVTGTEIATNIGDCLELVKELAQSEMSKVLETDQDFANKDHLNKDVKKARAALKDIVGKVRGEFVSYSHFEEVAQEMDSVLQKMQSHGEKQVKKAKEDKKKAIINEANTDLFNHIKDTNIKIQPMNIESISGEINPDWTSVMKNKRTIESLTSAANEEVARWKVEINQAIDRIAPNLEYLRDTAKDYKFLFSDAQQLINQDSEAFQAIVKSRIADHKKSEEERLEAERKRIQKEEEEKAQREAEAKAELERDRIRQEEHAKISAEREMEYKRITQIKKNHAELQKREQSEEKRIRDEERTKVEAEQKAEDESIADTDGPKNFKVKVEWSGYSRGYSVYEVEAESEEEALECYYEGNRIEHNVVRDDTEEQEKNIIK